MKKLFLSLIVMMTAATASAQWAVTDAGNLSQNLKNFKELQKQVGYLQQQKKLLDESLDMMRKVNSVVSDCETTRYIIERQARLSQKCVDLLSGKQLNPSTLQTLTSIEQIMAGNRRLIQLSRTILSTSVRMNDAERLSTLQNIEKQTLEEERKIARISQVINQYERLKRALR